MSQKILVLGASAAGIAVINTLATLHADVSITCISREKEFPYNKCFLADYVAGSKMADDLQILKRDYPQLNLILGKEAIAIDATLKMMRLNDGALIAYDALFLGLGSGVIRPTSPDTQGLEGVFTFHTLADTLAIQAYRDKTGAKTAVIVGAGLSGLECADALHAQGLQVHLVEKYERVLGAQLSCQAGAFLAQRITQWGISLACNAQVEAVESRDGRVTGVVVNGRSIPTDLLIYTTGLRANSAILPPEIQVQNGAVVVNEFMQTSVPDIYAGGDLILVRDQITGLYTRSCTWPDAIQQGAFAAQAMAGRPRPYPGVTMMVSSAFFGLKYAATLTPPLAPETPYKGPDFYHSYYLTKEGILQGFSLLGNTKDMPLLKRFTLTRQPMAGSTLKNTLFSA